MTSKLGSKSKPNPVGMLSKEELLSQFPKSTIDELLRGAVDLHCHSGPSVMPRRLNHIEAVMEVEEAGFRALLFKDHFYSVTPIARMLDEYLTNKRVKLLSGVPLNNSVGGFNCYAVDHGLKLGANLVWMPTLSAANHIRHEYKAQALPTSVEMLRPTGLTVLSDQGQVKDEVKFILSQIAKADAVLASGHLHISEIFPLFEEARAAGVGRFLVNHPTFVVDATMADIADLVAAGAYIEHSVCMYLPTKRFNAVDLDELIKIGTVERTILASDLGQNHNPTPVEGFRYVIATCLMLGYTPGQVRNLIGRNAVRLLGLEEDRVETS